MANIPTKLIYRGREYYVNHKELVAKDYECYVFNNHRGSWERLTLTDKWPGRYFEEEYILVERERVDHRPIGSYTPKFVAELPNWQLQKADRVCRWKWWVFCIAGAVVAVGLFQGFLRIF